MKMMSHCAIFAILIGLAAGVNAEEATLCQSHEEIYFSCASENKIISLCASGNVSPENGYVQYRFGTPDRIELQFPDAPYSPSNRFLISDIVGGNLNFTHIKFKIDGYDYVIYQGFPSGLYVKKGGGFVKNLVCEPGVYQQLNRRVYRGIKTVPPVDDIDD
ncbi:hypothetical protein [Paraburkholderia solisilvae]|uniref:hypothetical protein n=1 Tax=Paraburkholderia solisilvae TaxID=624376 RepID=UPI001581B969|nr:hypothetical protein [Paraburkholderia solisilvae]